MKVESLSLANFRGFKQIDLTFEAPVTVIAGVNGVGKSGILRALTALFSLALPSFTPAGRAAAAGAVLTDDDIRVTASALQASTSFTVDGQRCMAQAQRIRPDPEMREALVHQFERIRDEIASLTDVRERHTLEVEADRIRRLIDARRDHFSLLLQDIRAERSRTGELDAVKRETQRVLSSLRQQKTHPLVVFYSTLRQLAGRPRNFGRPATAGPSAAYRSALVGRDVSLRDFMFWFRLQQAREADGDTRAGHLLRVLREAVVSFVPEFTDLQLFEDPAPRFIVEKDGTPLGVDQLSDGERGLLSIIFDISRRLALANPGEEDPSSQGKAVVLIDEIELHLHPAWQRRVLAQFLTTFPRCQFIVTTHSPQVIGEAESRCMRFLVREDDRIIPWTPPHAFGLDANRVLEELMEVKPRDPEIDSELRGLFDLIDQDEFEAANERIEKIEARVGTNDPELTRARALIAFLTGEE